MTDVLTRRLVARSAAVTMAFAHKTYTLWHPVTKDVAANQAIMIPVDLSDIIVNGFRSALFTVDDVSLIAYKRGTYERIPVKFAVLNAEASKVLTHDVFKMASRWAVDTPHISVIQIAGTDAAPYTRTFRVHDEEARVATVNLLGFAASSGLWGVRDVKSSLALISKSKMTAFDFDCAKCLRRMTATVDRNANLEPVLFTFPLCAADNRLCTPSLSPAADDYDRAVCKVAEALRSASDNPIPGLDQLTIAWSSYLVPGYHTDCSTFPPRTAFAVVVPHNLLHRFAGLYDTMRAGVDAFAVVDSEAPHVRLIAESPSADIGLLTGSLSITMIYGHCLGSIRVSMGSGPEESQTEPFTPTEIAQMTDDLILKSIPAAFEPTTNASLAEWCAHHHDRRTTN